MWGAGGIQLYGIRDRRLVYKEVVQALSNLGILLVVIRLGVTGLKKTKLVYLVDVFEGRWENGQCDLMCVERLWMIGLMVVMLTFYSRVVSVVLVLWGLGPVLRNGYGI